MLDAVDDRSMRVDTIAGLCHGLDSGLLVTLGGDSVP